MVFTLNNSLNRNVDFYLMSCLSKGICQKRPYSNGSLIHQWLTAQPQNEAALSNKLDKEVLLKWYQGLWLGRREGECRHGTGIVLPPVSQGTIITSQLHWQKDDRIWQFIVTNSIINTTCGMHIFVYMNLL